MDIVFIFKVLQVVFAVLLVTAILLLQSESNVGGAFGGGDVSEQTGAKRRGGAKVVFVSTFVLATLFVISLIVPYVL